VVNPLVAAAPITHIVQPGENLTLIAQKYGLTPEQLMQANGLVNPDRIQRGQELKVWSAASAEASMAQTASADTAPAIEAAAPAVSAPPSPAVGVAAPAVSVAQTEALRHIVSYGETLGTIARRYNTTWQEIAAANGIVNIDRITAGQTLVIPGVAAATANASSANLPANASTPPRDMGILTTPANIVPAPPTITVGKQIVVDLSDQMVYAYQDGQLMYSVLGSTGLPATPTVQGDYKIYLRYAEQTMSGPGYWLPGVKWVQYFYQGYAFHTAYWHNNWGQPMSHGCVNLPEEAAKWLYDFATIGTPVHVRY
jgi:LysM repeat protein